MSQTNSPAMERARAFFFRDKEHPCDVPPLAHEYVWALAKKVGYCGEVCITGFAHYAQAEEKLLCTEEMYMLVGNEHYYKDIK